MADALASGAFGSTSDPLVDLGWTRFNQTRPLKLIRNLVRTGELVESSHCSAASDGVRTHGQLEEEEKVSKSSKKSSFRTAHSPSI